MREKMEERIIEENVEESKEEAQKTTVSQSNAREKKKRPAWKEVTWRWLYEFSEVSSEGSRVGFRYVHEGDHRDRRKIF